jgi:hypothetical protein
MAEWFSHVSAEGFIFGFIVAFAIAALALHKFNPED